MTIFKLCNWKCTQLGEGEKEEWERKMERDGKREGKEGRERGKEGIF